MKDGYLLKTIKWIALLRYTLDLGFTRRIRSIKREQHYRLGGSCRSCGKCCVTPMIPVRAPFIYLKTARWLLITWHRKVNGFEYIGENRKKGQFIFQCTHLDTDTMLCDAYDTRPGMCRDYPTNLLDAALPAFLEGCGFYPILKNAEQMQELLDASGLSGEKLKELKRKLHIE